jgi:hypothetical protein
MALWSSESRTIRDCSLEALERATFLFSTHVIVTVHVSTFVNCFNSQRFVLNYNF